MIKNKLIIIPFGFSWNWPCDYERQTASTLAKKNIVIAFLPNEGFSLKSYIKFLINGQPPLFLKKTGKNLFLFRPLYCLPFHRLNLVKKINSFLAVLQLRLLIFCHQPWRTRKKILWLFPSQLSLSPTVFGPDYFSLYDCVDKVTSLDKRIAEAKKIQEQKIIQEAKIIFTNSNSLYNLHKNSDKLVYLVPQGFNYELFFIIKKFIFPKELSKIPSPRIGFIGNINYKLDFNLIKNLAKANPSYSFVFIGPLDPDTFQDKIVNTQEKIKSLSMIKNIYFLGGKTKKQIPNFIKFLDIGFIPYDITQEFNRFCYPMKVFEYFYMGKPVVSTSIEELKRFPKFIKIGKTAKDFTRHIHNILKSGWPKKYQSEQKKLAVANSWQAKIEKISRIIINY